MPVPYLVTKRKWNLLKMRKFESPWALKIALNDLKLAFDTVTLIVVLETAKMLTGSSLQFTIFIHETKNKDVLEANHS